MPIRVGAPARVQFLFRDREDRDGVSVDLGPLDLSTVSVLTATLVNPRGERLEDLPLTRDDDAAGAAYLTLSAAQNDRAGTWRAQGYADGFPSDPVAWRVGGNL